VHTVEIVPPNPAWATEFRHLAGGLRAALGELALRIDHIGSTSVPGLAAKDVLDVQVTVPVLDPAVLSPRLTSVGLVHRPHVTMDHRPPGVTGPAEDWAKLYFRELRGQRAVHVHVREAGRANQRYALLFRDYLRAHPQTAEAYAELKRRLAALAIDSGTYADVKDPACDLIMIAAEAWASCTRWHPGPSDA
jgi:GrpB-like predicted nucleotidyltransferase (UPF0157 family)